jgi:hypothetical protein
VNLMDALRQSLERVSVNKKKAARIVESKPARAAKAAAPAARKRARG